MVTAGTAATAIRQRSAAGLSFLACDGSKGTPVLLLHGIGSNAQSFVPLMQAFDRRCAVLAWDAPGYGDSQPLAPAWPDAADYAGALDRLLAALDVARCVLLGHSLGALIAARFAAAWPRRSSCSGWRSSFRPAARAATGWSG